MADVPSGPSVLSPPPPEISPFSGSGVALASACNLVEEGNSSGRYTNNCAHADDTDLIEESEGKARSTDGGKGHHCHRPLNGLINSDLHHHLATSYKTEIAHKGGNVKESSKTGQLLSENKTVGKTKGELRLVDGSSNNICHADNRRTAENDSHDRNGLDQVNAQNEDALTTSLAACCLQDSEKDGGQPERRDITISYVRYESELQMPDIMRLITKDLSEPYSIYTYRYFIHNWPQLCFLAMVDKECVGAIVCKLDMHKKMFRRGYIAMLAVDSKYRRKGIGTQLVKKAIYAMVEGDCDEVVLETEITNKSALKLYENLGFVRDKRLFRYYLNGVDALRLKLWLR